jgi:hypothetical protein
MSDQANEPTEALRRLDRLTGTWRVTGGAEGTVTYEWMEGRFFLTQRVDLEQDGQRIRGVEIIGHTRPFDEVAEQLSTVLGRSIGFVPVPDDAAIAQMVAAGVPDWFATNVATQFRLLRQDSQARPTTSSTS